MVQGEKDKVRRLIERVGVDGAFLFRKLLLMIQERHVQLVLRVASDTKTQHHHVAYLLATLPLYPLPLYQVIAKPCVRIQLCVGKRKRSTFSRPYWRLLRKLSFLKEVVVEPRNRYL